MLVLVAVVCLSLAALLWLGAFHVESVHELDARVLERMARLDGTTGEGAVERLAAVIDPLPYALLCLAILGIGARAAGVRPALAAAVAIGGANVSTQLLKRALAEPRTSELLERQVSAATWPSGHATAATVVVLAALLLAPRRLRLPIAILGGAWAAAVAGIVVVNHWHYPSDALGGVLMAAAWTAVAAAGLRSSRPDPAATAAPRRRWLRATG